MTITFELTRTEEAKLRKRAAVRGVDIKTFLLELVENEPQIVNDPPDMARFEELLNQLAKPGPGLPDEALTREAIYGDHL